MGLTRLSTGKVVVCWGIVVGILFFFFVWCVCLCCVLGGLALAVLQDPYAQKLASWTLIQIVTQHWAQLSTPSPLEVGCTGHVPSRPGRPP